MDGERVVLAIDVGTQSTRALLIDNKGEILVKEKEEHKTPYFSKEADWAEQDSDFYYEKVGHVCKKVKDKAPKYWEKVEGVSITTIRSTTICIDEEGKPLRPAFVWLDNRKAKGSPVLPLVTKMALKAIKMENTIDVQYKKSHCNWIKEEEPYIWEKTHKYLFLSTYLIYRLTGNIVDSTASIVGRVPYDYKRRAWQKQNALTRPVFDVPSEKLCDLVEPGEILGEINKEASAHTGIAHGIPLIAAGTDKACEIIGLGCTDQDKLAFSFGTTATATCTTKGYVEPEKYIPPFCAIMEGHFHPEIEIFRGYWLVSWFKKEFGRKEVEQAKEIGKTAEELLNERLKEIPAGCDGLIFQPYFTPSTVMPVAKGAMIGFSDAHTRIHVYRAIIEGINFALMDGVRVLEKRMRYQFKEIRLGGGGAQSDEICQITADMFGLPTVRTQTHEVSGIGCAMATFVGLGEFKDYHEAKESMVRVRDVFAPDMEQHKKYNQIYEEIFKKVYGRLLPLYEKADHIR